MEPYNFIVIEEKWKKIWKEGSKPSISAQITHPHKYYILNMFPYPSGSGLHVGHYLGYIASDIVARYHKHNGYHVINPMGFDAFGLPAEQYAIQTGQHPAITTKTNINKYIEQFQQIGLDFDWDRKIDTSDPSYYKWTQWIFLEMFNAWYNHATQRAEPIATLIQAFEKAGNKEVQAACDPGTPIFSAEAWKNFSPSEQQELLLRHRLAYLKDSMVNWCEALGTVLANEEVKDGFSERGGYPVVRKQMKQWSLRMTAYAERLLSGLDKLDWPRSTKEMQRHWIGFSPGAEINFRIQGQSNKFITIFTTRPETIFGACFIAIAPEHPWADFIAHKIGDRDLIQYIQASKNKTERSRLELSMSSISGRFTSTCVIHPFTGAPLPIWIADYVLPNYGTAAIMGVPAHDAKDYMFAQFFELLALPVITSNLLLEEGPYEGKEGVMVNSAFLNGLSVDIASERIIQELVRKNIGRYQVHYKLKDPVFSRQRYWGEPFPIYYKEDGLPYALSADQLPLVLPEVSSYKPNPSGKPPLSNALNWTTAEGYPLEQTTMPGWAGSSWYFLRYMDPYNADTFVSKEQEAYWKEVDCYIGGAEHATGHLLYARFFTKVLHDLGHIHVQEPFLKLFHQGMIQNESALVYKVKDKNTFISFGLIHEHDVVAIYVPIAFVQDHVLDIAAFQAWRSEYADAEFLLEAGKYICGSKLEKMSKSKHNVVNPDELIAKYGADSLRLYIMFLGPLDQSKPWDLHGIEGCHRFLKKAWNFLQNAQSQGFHTESEISQDVHKIMHQTIKNVTESIERYSFHTAISSLMICLNRLSSQEKVAQQVVAQFMLLLEPFAPHIAAEMWDRMGYKEPIQTAAFPRWDPAYLAVDSYDYPVAINGKVRTTMTFSKDTSDALIEQEVLNNAMVQKWVGEKPIQKLIIIPNKMINIVT